MFILSSTSCIICQIRTKKLQIKSTYMKLELNLYLRCNISKNYYLTLSLKITICTIFCLFILPLSIEYNFDVTFVNTTKNFSTLDTQIVRNNYATIVFHILVF